MRIQRLMHHLPLQWMVRGHVAEALVFVLGNDTLDDLARASYGSWTTGFRV